MTQLRAVNTVEPAGVRAEPLLVPILAGWRKVEYLAGVGRVVRRSRPLLDVVAEACAPCRSVRQRTGHGDARLGNTSSRLFPRRLLSGPQACRAAKPPDWQSHRDGRDQGALRTLRGRGRDFGCDARPGRAARHLARRRGSVARNARLVRAGTACSSPPARAAPTITAPTWPRRTRCKEGNLAFSTIITATTRYDFVVQLDADHVPEPGYLFEMLRPFADPDGRLCLRAQHLRPQCPRKLVGARTSLRRSEHARLAAGRLQWRARAALHRLALCSAHQGAEGDRRPRAGAGGRPLDHADDERRRLARRACARRHRPWRRAAHVRRSCHAGIPVVAQPGHAAPAIFAEASPAACRCD